MILVHRGNRDKAYARLRLERLASIHGCRDCWRTATAKRRGRSTTTCYMGPPLPASGLPQGWTMEQWSYYGEQYLASMPPAPVDQFAQPVQQTYQPQQTAPSYNPLPDISMSEPAPSLLDRTMVQEQAPTPASQALADILDDLDL